MSISESDFRSAKNGDYLIDSNGTKWSIIYIQRGFSPLLDVSSNKGSKTIHFSEGVIVDIDFCSLNEFNNSAARFVRN